jgi:hypothetical protein
MRAAAASASTALPSATATCELPIEIWGLVADFSSRAVVLNLRSVSAALKSETERTISHLFLAGKDQITDFANSLSFEHMTHLTLRNCDEESLNYLASILAEKSNLTLHLRVVLNVDRPLYPRGFAAISTVGLASLSVVDGEIGYGIALALAEVNYPVHLHAGFTPLGLLTAGGIRTLTVLHPLYGNFNDNVARAFKAHPSLRSLVIPSDSLLTETGLRDIAQLPALRRLVVNCEAPTIDIETARALAPNADIAWGVVSGDNVPDA